MSDVIWNLGEDLALVVGLPSVWWLDLTSPLGNSPAGLDISIELPPGLRVLDPSHRPVFGAGPDAHRPNCHFSERRLELSFPGELPAENSRRPLTSPESWCALHYPLVVIAEAIELDGAALILERRAMGDSLRDQLPLRVYDDPGIEPPPQARRNIELGFFPWFSQHEQEALAGTLRRCGFSDISLNWFDHGIPLLPIEAYAFAARNLRKAMPGMRLWINGIPGAETIAPRARDHYGRPIPQVASPEALIRQCPDLVVSSVRGWCQGLGADGVQVTLMEPAVIDTDAMPAHCFSHASRQRFALEEGLPGMPDALQILHQHAEAWVAFCCRQQHRVLELVKLAIGGRPLSICALGPGGAAREEASTDWQQLGDLADILIYSHRREAQPAPERIHWGHTRIGSTPQQWWEHWNDPLGAIQDPELAIADCRMQLALSGNQGIRLWSWACLDGRLQHGLLTWR